MGIMVAVAILLVIQMLLTHLDRLVSLYFIIYKKIFKPKFKVGEYVMIDDIEFEIVLISKNSRPYTYFCLPVSNSSATMYESYYHESEICKKTGLLKELE
jgi:hypothetical protein